MKTIEKVTYSRKNTKLSKLEKVIKGKIVSFNLRAGYTCPCARDCLSRAVRIEDEKGTRFIIQDGKFTQFRCFAASREVLFEEVYYSHLRNEKIITIAKKSIKKAAQILSDNLPKNIKAVRIHASGDFKTASYFLAWMLVAKMNPNVVFYGYTKMVKFLIKYRKKLESLSNFRITASYGGKYDSLISLYNLPSARVVYSKKEAKSLNLPIDKNDSLAYNGHTQFALLIHGTQPKNTIASRCWEKLRKETIRRNKNKKNKE